jgi:hypothetical protein
VAQRRPWEVEDEPWELIEQLLPKVERRFRNPCRKRLDDRCWRRLRDWHKVGCGTGCTNCCWPSSTPLA